MKNERYGEITNDWLKTRVANLFIRHNLEEILLMLVALAKSSHQLTRLNDNLIEDGYGLSNSLRIELDRFIFIYSSSDLVDWAIKRLYHKKDKKDDAIKRNWQAIYCQDLFDQIVASGKQKIVGTSIDCICPSFDNRTCFDRYIINFDKAVLEVGIYYFSRHFGFTVSVLIPADILTEPLTHRLIRYFSQKNVKIEYYSCQRDDYEENGVCLTTRNIGYDFGKEMNIDGPDIERKLFVNESYEQYNYLRHPANKDVEGQMLSMINDHFSKVLPELTVRLPDALKYSAYTIER